MADKILTWLKNQLGFIVEPDIGKFSETTRDGSLLGKVLKSYEIINDSQAHKILQTDDTQIMRNNYKHLVIWLKNINIILSPREVEELINGNSEVALNFFHRVYLSVNDKHLTHYLAEQRKVEKLRPSDLTKFQVTPVKEGKAENFDYEFNKLCKPLHENYDVVHWHRDRMTMLLQKCENARQQYLEFLNIQANALRGRRYTAPYIKHDDTGGCLSHNLEELNTEASDDAVSSSQFSFDELMRQQEAAKEIKPFQPDPKEAKRIINKVKIKRKKEVEKDFINSQIQRNILTDILEQKQKDQEDNFNKNISQKLLKQSYYEKQMVQKLADVKYQKDVMINNRRIVDDEVLTQKERDFVENILLRDKNVSEARLKYYLENERILELHKRIYEEKLRLRAERQYKMAYDALSDMTDIAMRHAEYKQVYGEEPPRRVQDNWKNLFLHEQPIYDIVEPVQKIICCRGSDLTEDEEEEIVREIARQDSLDEQDFEGYQNYQWPWEIEMVNPNEEVLKQMDCGLNVIGNIVHHILLAKYPLPPPPKKPDFPEVKIAACVNGISDTSTLPILQKLLLQKEIKVIEIPDVINYCIDAYKQETTTEYVDNVIVEETEEFLKKSKSKKGKVNEKKEKKKKKATDDTKTKKGSKKTKPSKTKSDKDLVPEGPQFAEKNVQTPIIYPCEEIILSQSAELGKTADEELSLGQPLTDYLITAMFVEYLKSIHNLKGWVLINYPTTFEQAALLEECLTGLPVPGISNKLTFSKSICDYYDVEPRYDQQQFDENAKYRKSKILPDPVIPEVKDFYDTYLTAYIKVKQKTSEKESTIESTGAVDLPPVEEDLDEPVDALEKFYADLGCNYSLYYKDFDLPAIKYLGKLIIGEFSIPMKSSVELFGDTVLYIEAGIDGGSLGLDIPKSAKKGQKKNKPKEKSKKNKAVEDEKDSSPKKSKKDKSKKGKSEASSKKSKKGKKDKAEESVIIVHEDKTTQIPEVEEEPPVEEEEPAPIPAAGEPGWEYVNIKFSNELELALATLWTNAETVYVDDMKQIFFVKRVVMDAVMPFVQFVKEHMLEFIKRPDNKQYFLSEFQTTYNSFDPDFRQDNDFKAELHCRIEEFRQKLIDMCDKRMMESENERQGILSQHWVPKQLCELSNNYINAFQTEIDRNMDSIQLINDYYSSMVTNMPSEEALEKVSLKRADCFTDEVWSQIFHEFSTEMDKEGSYMNKTTTFHANIEDILKKCEDQAYKNQAIGMKVLQSVGGLFSPKSRAGEKGKKAKEQKMSKGEKKTKSENTVAGQKPLLKIFEPSDEVKEGIEKIIEEWSTAILGETARIITRLQLIKADAFARFNDVINTSLKVFLGSFEEIRARYENEVKSVKQACDILSRAVEEEVAIQPELILEGDKFFINPDVILFPDPIEIPKPVTEVEIEGVFTIEQLDYITDILLDLAPTGYIPERSFIFLLQDLIALDVEDGKPPMVPNLWRSLTPREVGTLSGKFFRNAEYVTWKDFLINNLLIPVPSEKELLDTRSLLRQYDPDLTELIRDYQFFSTKLWYEVSDRIVLPSEQIRNDLVKKLLFKMYKVKYDCMNYTALLLDFCKDRDATLGFAKALEMALGKLVCWNKQLGEEYVKDTLRRREEDKQRIKQREQEIEENKEMAGGIIDELVDKSVHQCDSVVIEDFCDNTDENLTDIQDEPIIENLPKETRLEEKETVTQCEESEENCETVFDVVSAHSLPQEHFSNIAIGFEEHPSPPLAYFLNLDLLMDVVTCTLPWHSKVQNVGDQSVKEIVEELFEECKNPEFNSCVLIHEFLNHKTFQAILKMTTKFSSLDPIKIIHQIKDNVVENK